MNSAVSTSPIFVLSEGVRVDPSSPEFSSSWQSFQTIANKIKTHCQPSSHPIIFAEEEPLFLDLPYRFISWLDQPTDDLEKKHNALRKVVDLANPAYVASEEKKSHIARFNILFDYAATLFNQQTFLGDRTSCKYAAALPALEKLCQHLAVKNPSTGQEIAALLSSEDVEALAKVFDIVAEQFWFREYIQRVCIDTAHPEFYVVYSTLTELCYRGMDIEMKNLRNSALGSLQEKINRLYREAGDKVFIIVPSECVPRLEEQLNSSRGTVAPGESSPTQPSSPIRSPRSSLA